MATKALWLGVAGLLGQGCLGESLEGSRSAAAAGTQVEVMLIPIDDGASITEGADAFDDGMPTTESLDDLARGRGAFVVGVVDGWGIALVPTGLTDEARDVAGAALDEDHGDNGDPWQDDQRYLPEETPSCAGDCTIWCTTTLDLCSGDGFALCDCTVDDSFDDAAPPPDQACTWDCTEWCTTTLDHCGGDGYALCDCAADDAFADPAGASCTWDCAEWCTTALDYCGDDGWTACGDSCGWYEAQALPPSASAGIGPAPFVVAGVALLIVMTDPEVQQALDRGESIGDAVGGTYGRRAQVIMERLRQIRREMGAISDDAQLPCVDLLARQGYAQHLDVAADQIIRVGICSQDQLTVWPSEITVRSPRDYANLDVRFDNLGSGFRTFLSRDAEVTWYDDDGQGTTIPVVEGSNAHQSWEMRTGATQPLYVGVPRDGSATTRVNLSLVH